MFQGYGGDGVLKSQEEYLTHTSCTRGRKIKEDLRALVARVTALEG